MSTFDFIIRGLVVFGILFSIGYVLFWAMKSDARRAQKEFDKERGKLSKRELDYLQQIYIPRLSRAGLSRLFFNHKTLVFFDVMEYLKEKGVDKTLLLQMYEELVKSKQDKENVSA